MSLETEYDVCINNLIIMLQYRKYNVSNDDITAIKDIHSKNLKMPSGHPEPILQKTHKSVNMNELYVFYISKDMLDINKDLHWGKPRVSINTFYSQEKGIRKIMSKYLEKNKTYTFIVIFEHLKKLITQFHEKAPIYMKEYEQKIQLQIFSIQELQFDLMSHILVPKHILHPPQFYTDYLKQEYHIDTPIQLLNILVTDPCAKYIGAESGDIIEIQRPSIKSGITKVFRYCI